MRIYAAIALIPLALQLMPATGNGPKVDISTSLRTARVSRQVVRPVNQIYQFSGFRRLWTDHNDVSELARSISGAIDHGLVPADYNSAEVQEILSHKSTLDSAQIDILLTEAFMLYGNDLFYGRVNPYSVYNGKYDFKRDSVDLATELLNALLHHNIAETLQEMAPAGAEYSALCRQLTRFRQAEISRSEDLKDSINKVLVNMERWRWMPRNLPSNYIIVNIPSFNLRVIDADTMALSMAAIVGKPERPTPILSSSISSIVFNPYWTIPPTILKEDVLPAIQKDSTYVASHQLRLFDYLGTEIHPDSLDASDYDPERFQYMIRQDPGIRNALGLLKFQFRNRFGIYIHDTNMPALFRQSYRALSSGCIRVQQPVALASFLLKGSAWTTELIRKEIEGGKTSTVALRRKVPVYVLYFTAYSDNHGFVTYEDIYKLDPLVIEELLRTRNRPGLFGKQ